MTQDTGAPKVEHTPTPWVYNTEERRIEDEWGDVVIALEVSPASWDIIGPAVNAHEELVAAGKRYANAVLAIVTNMTEYLVKASWKEVVAVEEYGELDVADREFRAALAKAEGIER